MEKDNTQMDIPHTLTQDILKYLEQQEHLTGEDVWPLQGQYSGLLRVHSILEEILGNIADRAQLIEDFQAQLKAHNQYPLFDLSSIIPDFCIDENMYEKLSFREHLVISMFEDGGSQLVPQIVGGLCLDIQTARGNNPLLRKNVGLEQRLIDFITFKANEIRKNKNDSRRSPSSEDVPKPSAVTLDSSLSKSEKLESDPELQDFIEKIQPLYERPYCKFLVHVSSQFDVAGQNGGSRITAWVDRNFHTLEEKRTEYVMKGDLANEKTLYCAMQARRYYVKHTNTTEQLVDKKYYSMGKTRDLVCEGANFILMRYLAITRYIGTFELSTMYINGDMCRNIYECTGPESGIVNGTKLDLCTIHRTIIEECGIIHQCITVLTLNGRMVKQEWNNCDYILQVNPLVEISNEKLEANERILLPKVWEQDMQLFSKFLDMKTTYAMEMKSYLTDHVEFKNMMADYIQATLLMKPTDIVDFTIKHFQQYCTAHRYRNESYSDEQRGESFIRF